MARPLCVMISGAK
ncbi:unnamed protein product [Staurois parvus]|uniref:Uncharacterized protein n=1 Tax=Staurois parvus TaxID=386267 RepID=A0ABN9CWF9_9NEOB|nr:unnamed protein product [Staurois parvus]